MFQVLKTRLALGRTGEYRNFLDCGMKIYQQDGKKVFFRGLVPGLIGIIPYAGVDLCIYEVSNRVLLIAGCWVPPSLDKKKIDW